MKPDRDANAVTGYKSRYNGDGDGDGSYAKRGSALCFQLHQSVAYIWAPEYLNFFGLLSLCAAF